MTETEEAQRCLFWSDSESAPGYESETVVDGLVVCEAEATAIVRVKSGAVSGYQGHALWRAGHVPMCDTHATYLQEDAQIEWEVLGTFLDQDEIADRVVEIDPEWVPSAEITLTNNV